MRSLTGTPALPAIALAGGTPVDGDPDSFTAGCFGAAAYPADTADVPEAALRASLGCGNPLAVADLQPGEIVLDLGSGGGLDVLLSARRVAPGGIAYGLDASTDMLALSRTNAVKAGVTNAQFLHGHIEDIPLPDEHVDVIISNCVINLSATRNASWPRHSASCGRAADSGISDMIADEGIDAEQLRCRPAHRCRAAGRLHQRRPDSAAIPQHAASSRVRQHHHYLDPPSRRRRALRDHSCGQIGLRGRRDHASHAIEAALGRRRARADRADE